MENTEGKCGIKSFHSSRHMAQTVMLWGRAAESKSKF